MLKNRWFYVQNQMLLILIFFWISRNSIKSCLILMILSLLEGPDRKKYINSLCLLMLSRLLEDPNRNKPLNSLCVLMVLSPDRKKTYKFLMLFDDLDLKWIKTEVTKDKDVKKPMYLCVFSNMHILYILEIL